MLIDETLYYGVTNIGYNPTFGEGRLTVETHVLDFSGDLLGKTIKINFLHRLRDEKTFKGVAELTEHIVRDIAQARGLLGLKEAGRKTA